VVKVAQFLLMVSPVLLTIWLALQLAFRDVLHGREALSPSQVYWRFISGFCQIRSGQGRFEQIGQFMHIAQIRINTGDCAFR
jgi:hypothetical protein